VAAAARRARFVYEFVLRSAVDIETSTAQDRLRRTLTGERPSDDAAFVKPSAVAARQGRIYVTDTANHVVVVFDVPRRRLFRFGVREPGTLRKPVALALDGQGRVYVADAARREVLVYDALGLWLSTIAGTTSLPDPRVAVSREGDRVYVIDRADNDNDGQRVLVFDAAGAKLAEIGRRGSGPGEFNVPLQGAIGPDGTLYVLDAGNFRVQAFDREGRFLRAFGAAGNALGQLARPRGLAVDDEGNVYVTDASFGNFQVFDAAGRLLLAVGRAGASDRRAASVCRSASPPTRRAASTWSISSSPRSRSTGASNRPARLHPDARGTLLAEPGSRWGGSR